LYDKISVVDQDVRQLSSDFRTSVLVLVGLGTFFVLRSDEKASAMEKRIDEKASAMEKRMDEKAAALEKRMDEKLDRNFNITASIAVLSIAIAVVQSLSIS